MSSPNQLSFLPEDYLERKARRRAVIVCGGLSVIVLGAIGAMFTMNEQMTRLTDTRYADAEAKYARAAAQIEQVQRMHTKQRQIVQHAELAATLVEKVPRSNLLAEFTNALPPGVSLLELTMESKQRQAPPPPPGTSAFELKKAALEAKPKSNEPQPTDVFLKLTGMADNDVQVAQFIQKLNASKLLADVNLVISDSFQREKTTLRRFQIEMMVNPEAEVRESPVSAKVKAVAAAAEPLQQTKSVVAAE